MTSDADRLAELSRLLARGVSTLSDDELIAAARASAEITQRGREVTGRLLATLYERDKLSWPKIAQLTGLSTSTAYTWAQPYLTPDRGDERGSRQGRSRDHPEQGGAQHQD